MKFHRYILSLIHIHVYTRIHIYVHIQITDIRICLCKYICIYIHTCPKINLAL